MVSAFDYPNGYEVGDLDGKEDYWMWIGRSAHGRVLAVVYTEEGTRFYHPITEFDAERRFRDEYDNHRAEFDYRSYLSMSRRRT